MDATGTLTGCAGCCPTGCDVEHPCPPGKTCCNGVCVDDASLGDCGCPCPDGKTCVDNTGNPGPGHFCLLCDDPGLHGCIGQTTAYCLDNFDLDGDGDVDFTDAATVQDLCGF